MSLLLKTVRTVRVLLHFKVDLSKDIYSIQEGLNILYCEPVELSHKRVHNTSLVITNKIHTNPDQFYLFYVYKLLEVSLIYLIFAVDWFLDSGTPGEISCLLDLSQVKRGTLDMGEGFSAYVSVSERI